MSYHYILYVDEAGDDKTESLKPGDPNGNSEWLCLGGYVVRANFEASLEERRNTLLRDIGGQDGGVLHYRNYKPKNRLKVCKKLATFRARAFVVCSFKKTMVGHSNPRAATSGGDERQILYNFVTRLLLERVTEFVHDDAVKRGHKEPVLKIVMASRKGHHFGHFKEYVQKLLQQAKEGTTFLGTKEIRHEVLRYDQIERAPASKVPGLQLADAVVSATFQSIEQSSPHYSDRPALDLSGIIAKKKHHPWFPKKASNVGMTLFKATEVLDLLSDEQWEFFEAFGYDRVFLRKRRKSRK
ncbi:DUF3800 domain-containing protein [Aliiroseovarius crassostreae]|uniref:DUF3800 domain-containing protein n=1 Tax=Aliiroseovarius crassostreae TaxID=154981 RepID=UPI00220F16B1|nr:DUF3800 domain-containing protein [Aliiroseovarius crassostreae]UWP91400.1 DUF3800 domain-containing protein [Aliiroseovarius crassostreae]